MNQTFIFVLKCAQDIRELIYIEEKCLKKIECVKKITSLSLPKNNLSKNG